MSRCEFILVLLRMYLIPLSSELGAPLGSRARASGSRLIHYVKKISIYLSISATHQHNMAHARPVAQPGQPMRGFTVSDTVYLKSTPSGVE